MEVYSSRGTVVPWGSYNHHGVTANSAWNLKQSEGGKKSVIIFQGKSLGLSKHFKVVRCLAPTEKGCLQMQVPKSVL